MKNKNIREKEIGGETCLSLRDIHRESKCSYPFTVWLQKRVKSLGVDESEVFHPRREFAMGRPKTDPFAPVPLALCFMATESHKKLKSIILDLVGE